MNRRWLKVGAIVLALGIVGGGVALSENRSGRSPGKFGRLEQSFLTRLADELGISPEKLQAAMKAAGVRTIDDAVKAGILTADQAAELKRRIASGDLDSFGFGFKFGRFKHHGRPSGFKHGRHAGLLILMRDERARVAVGDAVAKALGTTPAKLAESLKNGSDLEALMKAKGVSAEELGAAAAAAAGPHLDRLVKAGTIDRAAADQTLDFLRRGAWLGKLIRLARIAAE